MKLNPQHYSFIFLFVFLLNVAFSYASNTQGVAREPQIVSTGDCSYSLTLTTSASAQTIWQLWYDVENWKDYDTVLQYSYLENGAEFAVGATGYVKARRAPKTKFELTEVEFGKSFVESLKLPLWSTLDLKRRVVRVDANTVAFTHEVEFKGRFKSLMYFILAKRFKKDLRMVMENMKKIAEQKKE